MRGFKFEPRPFGTWIGISQEDRFETKAGVWKRPAEASPKKRVEFLEVVPSMKDPIVVDDVPYSAILCRVDGITMPWFVRWHRATDVPAFRRKGSGMRNSPMKAFLDKKTPKLGKKSSRA